MAKKKAKAKKATKKKVAKKPARKAAKKSGSKKKVTARKPAAKKTAAKTTTTRRAATTRTDVDAERIPTTAESRRGVRMSAPIGLFAIGTPAWYSTPFLTMRAEAGKAGERTILAAPVAAIYASSSAPGLPRRAESTFWNSNRGCNRKAAL